MRRLIPAIAASSLMLALVACVVAGQPAVAPTAANTPTAISTQAVEWAPRFINEDEGYTLRFTSDYNLVLYQRSVCFTTAEGVEMVCHVANAFIDVSDAEGQTLAQAADAVAANANPEIEVQRSEIEVGGEPAVLLDDIYAYDVLRKVVVLHGERLYVLTFVPWVPELDDFSRINALYETIIETMEFLG